MSVDATLPPFALGALAALRRARLRAIEVARATNTCLVVCPIAVAVSRPR
jgi:hypothetical protein